MCAFPKYDQMHIKLISKSNQKMQAKGSEDILKHWKLSVQEKI